MENKFSSKVLTENVDDVLQIKSRPFASENVLLAPYKDVEVFVSEELAPDFKFSSVGLSWDEVKNSDANKVELQIRFNSDGLWSDWVEVEEEQDPVGKAEDGEKKYGMVSGNESSSFQYKFLLYGDGKTTPIVKNINYTYVHAGLQVSYTKPVASYAAEVSAEEISSYIALANDVTTVISRSQWGADESFRYLADNSQDAQLVQLDPDFYNKYESELKYSKVIDADENGDKYKWPLQYPEKVEKIIIHHTATTGNLDNPKQAIRDIYHYHAVTRGWGDIGYNYIVDQEGKIYEGRYGGEGVIGAHSGSGNHGSIGIAILGNFEENPVSDKILAAVGQFMYKKSKIHGFKASSSSSFRGEDMPNVFGHRDIMKTACPGQYLYSKIPALRILASQDFQKKDKFVQDFDFQDLSELYYFELGPLETKEISIEMENIGTETWGKDTVLGYQAFDDYDGVVSFPDSESKFLAKMQPGIVEPGEKATFKFKIKSNKKAANLSLEMWPIVDGTNATKDKLSIPFEVQQPIYKYQIVDSKYPSKMMKSLTEFDGYVKIKNIGNMIWEKDGDAKVDLRKSENSSFISPASNILATLSEDSVGPGETATFELHLTAPEKAGYYQESFSPFIEGTNWASDPLSFETTIYEREYDGEFVTKTSVNNWEQGKIYNVSIKLRNIGSKTWNKKDLKVGFVKNKDVKIQDVSISPGEIAPGDIADVGITVKVDSDSALGKKTMYIRPKIKGHGIVRKPVVLNYEIITQQFEEVGNEKMPDIRIKLSFDGDPEITANGSFEVYSGKNILTTLSAGEVAKVTYENGKYKVSVNDLNFLKSEEIRFVPKKNSILQIKNFEHHPSWKPELNDNEYRGILEVRFVDSKLVVINELGLESYLKGLGEVSDSELEEKIKTIIVAARSYAKYYIDIDEKFPGLPYNLDDDPDVSQKYLGYGFEKRAPNIASAVDSTAGKVVHYDGNLVKTPYFNQSDGTKTKSAKEVWGWDAPYLVSVDDSFCKGDKFLGHGVGLSGCGAKVMAEQGYDYEEILQHYYTGVEIVKEY